MSHPVSKRAIFFVGGYDPKSPNQFFARMAKEVRRFEALWGYEVEMSPVLVTGDDRVGVVTLEAHPGGAANEAVTTQFHFLVLDSLVLADFASPLPVRLGKYLRVFADFVLSGTAFRIFASAWRFGLYFLYPFVAVLGFAAIALAASLVAAALAGLWGWLAAPLVFFALLAILGERWSINHLMDLWSFSNAFIHGRRQDAETLMGSFADAIVERTRPGAFDEIILVGHSTGGLLILDIAAKCLDRAPAFSSRAPKIALLTLGSTALKAGLHPRARRFHKALERLNADPQLRWLEVQCLTDIINFYKSDPVADSGIAPRAGFPLVRRVRMKDMLETATYKRIRRNFFRVHYQYIFGNTKRYWYDFFQICLGPVGLIERAEASTAGRATQDAVRKP